MCYKNLLLETNECLNENGKTWNDVQFVKAGEYVFLPESFEKVGALMNFNYDAGYGSPEVIRDLMVVGAGWWLEREEYDGSEWWTYKTQPTMPENPKPWPEQLTSFGSDVYFDYLYDNDKTPTIDHVAKEECLWEDSDYRCVYSDKPLVNEG